MKQITRRWTYRTLTSVLYLAGTLCLTLFVLAKLHQTIASELALNAIDERTNAPLKTLPDTSKTPSSPLSQLTLPKPDKSDWSSARKTRFEVATLSKPIGKILIDEISLEAPIFEGDSELNLNKGVAKVLPANHTRHSSNLVIAGHRDSFFRRLGVLKNGAIIHITMADGKEHTYQMTNHWIVKPEDTWVMAEVSQDVLTLITCYPFYFVGSAPERYIVRAVKRLPNQKQG
ncbi:class D sortase [Shewanella maritima]|nr:class D sortase [Shewanella maritima]